MGVSAEEVCQVLPLSSRVIISDVKTTSGRKQREVVAVEPTKMFGLVEGVADGRVGGPGSQPSWARGQGEVAASQGASWCRQPAGRKDLEDGRGEGPAWRLERSEPGSPMAS